MALPFEALRFVRDGLRAAGEAGCASQRVLSLGYPDVLARPEQIGELFGAQLVPLLEYRADSAAIARWQGLPGEGARIVEAVHLFALLGYDLEVLDVGEIRGGEMIHDLNTPVPAAWRERYALVIDPGTLEHCFNIAQAARSAAEMVAPGGCVFHGNPVNMYNHGFYNLSPTWYHDFYRANGFKILAVAGAALSAGEAKLFPVPAVGRFAEVPPNASLYVLARRVSVQAIAWPEQSKYLANPTQTT